MIASGYDSRDYRYAVNPSGLPETVSLKAYAGAIDNQLSVGSCTACALTSAMELLCKRGGFDVELSRLFLYYNARPDPTLDIGSNIREAIKTLVKIGVPLESAWPYEISKVNVKPSAEAYTAAEKYRVERFSCTGTKLASDNEQRKAALAQGYPVIIGMYMEGVGNHSMCIVGYDKTGFIVENSWGEEWGDGGYFTLSYEDATAKLYDSWVIEGVLGVKVASLWTPPTRGSRVFLDPYDQFKLSSPNARVYGAEGAGILLLNGAQNITADQLVQTVTVGYSHVGSYKQEGNQLIVYADYREVLRWSVGKEGYTLVCWEYPMPITFKLGQMLLDGRPVSSVGPLRWEDM